MNIRYAIDKDLESLSELGRHIMQKLLSKKIIDSEIIVAYDSKLIGWLRFNYFWDNIPFMNMLYILEGYRRKTIGRQLVQYWEHEMSISGYKSVMTSTLSNEDAQHFYRKLGYKDIGGFVLPEEPFEILFLKSLTEGAYKPVSASAPWRAPRVPR